MKKVRDIIKEIEIIAPKNLKEDFDNVGLMVGDKEKEVLKVLLALDCTLDVIEEAKQNKVDLIITHHPLIFKRPSNITTGTLQGKKIIELIKNDISLYSSHTNLDSVEGGLNDVIVELLGYESSEVLEKNNTTNNTNSGLGRIIRLDHEISLNSLLDKVKKELGIKNFRIVKGKDKIDTIAIINGSGQDFIGKAISKGANCIITGDTTYHFASDYKEMGVSIIDIGHFSSEWKAFIKVMEKLEEKFHGIEFIVSSKSEDPYKFI